MKYFTRKLYQAMQDPLNEEFDRKWEETCAEYRKHKDSVIESLPVQAKILAGTTFHDGVVRDVSQSTGRTLELIVDASHNPWGPRGVFKTRFDGIRSVSDLAGLIGNVWLYEEIDVASEGAFEYRVLFDKSELLVVATSVTIEAITSAAKPSIP